MRRPAPSTCAVHYWAVPAPARLLRLARSSAHIGGRATTRMENKDAGTLQRLLAGVLGLAFSAATALSPAAAAAEVQGVRIPAAPNPLLTEDAQQAWQWLAKYNDYVMVQAPREQEPGCELCRENREMLQDTWKTVASYYFDPTGRFSQAQWAQQLLATLQDAGGVLTSKQQVYEVMQGMIEASLPDRYSRFLPPSAFREALHQPSPAERQQLVAEYGGVGVVIGEQCAPGGWVVEASLPESTAEEAGVKRGDCLTSIDGQALHQLSPSEVTALLRGANGTPVKLGLHSPLGRTRSLELQRRELPQPPTRQLELVAPGCRAVQYLRMHYFAKDTPRAVQHTLEAGENKQVLGYILDLRSNSGGSFDAAVEVATFFLPQGAPIASTVTVRFGGGVDGEWQVGHLDPETFPSLPGTLTSRPVVVLTNSSTASASEMLLGALRDNNRAIVVGERTFGKGLVQDYFAEPDGSGLELTVAKYLTPSGWDVTEQGGFEPDVMCHDHPRGWGGSPDDCVAQALHLLGGPVKGDVAAAGEGAQGWIGQQLGPT